MRISDWSSDVCSSDLGKLPTVLWKTPYNEHKVRGGPARYAIEAVRRGYAFIVQNERGRYFSQGDYEILGYPQTDGYDALSWIAEQPWSNGKRSEEHTSELQSLMRISYACFCLKKKTALTRDSW